MHRATAALLASSMIALVSGVAALPVVGGPAANASAATSIVLWGSGGGNTLGTGTEHFENSQLLDPRAATMLAGGSNHVLALADDGTVWAWGANQFGELGADPDTTVSSTQPLPVTFPPAVQIIAVAAGDGTSYALSADGDVYAWGDNRFGQLATAPTGTPRRFTPAVVSIAGTPGDRIVEIAAGASHVLARTQSGAVWGWGTSALGQTGHTGGNGNCPTLDGPVTCDTTPVDVGLGVAAAQVAAGDQYSMVLTTGGAVLDFGLALAGTAPVGAAALTVVPDGGATRIAAGLNFGLALTPAGRVIGWGDNSFGQLGDGTTDIPTQPVEAALPPGSYDEIAAGTQHALALRQSDGHVYAWGLNGNHNVSPASLDSVVSTPLLLTLPDDAGAALIAAGYTYSVASINASVAAPTWVDDAPPTTATVGVPYPSYTFHANGTPAPTYVAVVDAVDTVVPDGLTLDPVTGVLSGTPTFAADYTFRVHAIVQSLGVDVPGAEITIHVAAAPPPPPTPPTWTANTPPVGTVNSSYSYQFLANGNPAPTFLIALGALPPGLTLDDQSGLLAGVPTSAGHFAITVRASNGGGNIDVRRTITVVSPASSGISDPEDLKPSGQQVLQAAKIAYDGAGNAYEVNQRHFGNFNDRLYLRVHPPGGPWGPQQLIPTPANTYVYDVDFAVNNAGDIAVAYRDGAIAVVRRPAGGAWGPIQEWASPGSSGPASGCPLVPHVDIGNDATTVVTWSAINSCNGLVTVWRVVGAAFTPATGWSALQVWGVSTQDSNSEPAVAVADNGRAVVAFGARNSTPNQNEDLWTVECSGGVWAAPVLRSTLTTGGRSAVSADSAGNTIAIAWYGGDETNAVVQTNGVWEAATTIAFRARWVDRGPGVAVGADGAIYVAFAETSPLSFAVHVASRPAGSFFTDTIVSPLSIQSENPDVAVSASGDVVAVWEEFANGWFASSALLPNGGSWPAQPEPVTTTPSDNHLFPWAAMDSGGHALVVASPTTQATVTSIDTRFYVRDAATPPAAAATLSRTNGTVGDVVACFAGNFGGTPPFHYFTTWFQNGVPIAGVSGDLAIRAEDVGQEITCEETAFNEGGSATTQRSAALVPVPDDADGVPAAVEDGAPNGGDGNADGTLDSRQAEVSSLPNAVDNAYVTIVSPSGTALSSVTATAVPASPAPPVGGTFPVGVLGFRVDNVTTPSIDVHLLLPPGSAPTTFYKLQNGAYVDATAATASNGSDVTLTLVDNGPFDTDPTTGVIVDPLLPAVVSYHAPVAVADTTSTNEDSALAVAAPGVLANDSVAPSHSLTATLVTATAHGTLAFHANGSYSYAPAANYNGPDAFTYKASDGTTTSNTVTVSLTVAAVNDVPSFNKGPNQSSPEDGGTRTVNGWATAIKRGPTNESGQAVDFIVNNDNSALFSTQPAVNAAGALTYRAAADANGIANVIVQIHDNGGTAGGGVDTSAAQTFTIRITPVNDAPVATAAGATTAEDTATSIVLAGSDIDGDATSFSIVNAPAHGKVTLVGTRVCTGTRPAMCTRTASYTPAANYSGGDSFQYRANDGHANSPPVTVSITVTAVADAPTISSISSKSTRRNNPVTVSFSVGDVDSPLTTLVVTGTSSNTTLVPNANLAFSGTGSSRSVKITPAPTRTGTTVITIQVSDGVLVTSRSFTLNVT